MKLPAHIALTGRKRPVSGSDRTPVYAVVGNPNCGKTALFNLLTGARQKVANYAGVTVERKVGSTRLRNGQTVSVVDLPGEQVTLEVIEGQRAGESAPDAIVAVVDATNLRMNLRLVLELDGEVVEKIGPGGVFGELALDDGCVQAVLEVVRQHAASADGLLVWGQRPERLRRGLIARLPAMAPRAQGESDA